MHGNVAPAVERTWSHDDLAVLQSIESRHGHGPRQMVEEVLKRHDLRLKGFVDANFVGQGENHFEALFRTFKVVLRKVDNEWRGIVTRN